MKREASLARKTTAPYTFISTSGRSSPKEKTHSQVFRVTHLRNGLSASAYHACGNWLLTRPMGVRLSHVFYASCQLLRGQSSARPHTLSSVSCARIVFVSLVSM